MRIWLILFLSYYVAIVQGQTVITGTAKSADDSKPLAGLSITIKPKASANLLTYALTDHKGSYQLTFKSPADSVVITLSGLNVKKQVAIYANKSRSLHFSVTHEDIVLKEVKVKPPAIRRLDDTLNYAVDHFTGKNDRTIGEVLRKMPGIKIADDGSISYNDKAINRFYIDDHDLLQGRYNLATNNLEAKDVETVQVLENHQPIKALKDKDFSEQAAINLKLKDNAKNVLTANTQVGAGVAPVLWNNELFAMFFGKGKQFMGTYKGNNTGDDSAGDLNNFYVGGWNFGFPVCLGIQSPSGPGVGRKRYLLNRDNAVSLNGLRAYGKDYKLTANVSYASDHQQKDSYSRAENYLPGDSTLVIEERMKATERFHYLDAAVKLNANTPQFYFDNALKFSGDLQRDEYGSVENSQFITQNRSAPYIRLINDFSMIKNYKKLTLKISSYNGYGRINDNLNIQPLLYPALFSDHGTITGMQQSLKQQTFVSYNNVGFGLNHGRFRQNYSAGAGMSLLNLNSALSGELESGRLGNTADTLSNSLKWNRYDLSLSPEYTYKDKKLIVNLKLPLNNITQHSNDDILGVSKNMNRLFFNPSLSIDYKLNLLWTLYGSAAYSQNIDGAENGYTGYIMRSYRYLVHNEGQLPESSSRSYNMSIKYAHPIDMVFASFGGGYYRSKMNLLYGNVFNGFLAVRKTLEIPNTSNGFNVSFSLDKGLDGIVNKFNISAGYNNSESSQINQNEIIEFLNQSFAVGSGIDAKFGRWGDLNYRINFSRSENVIRNDARDFIPINSASQSSQLNFFPANRLIVNLKYEYSYNSAITGSGRLMNFADAGIKYRLKKLDLNIIYNNIFNTRRYISAAYNGIGSYYSSYELRPAQVLVKVRFKIK